jgi:protein-disulfide isomerase/uncharacterized membrane protein
MEHILNSLLYRSNITTIDKQDLYLQLLSHNEFPSIKAVTDTLDYFGIESIAANVPTDALAQMPDHFLALQTETNQSELVLVKKKSSKIQYTDQANKKHTKSYDDFSENWTGTIIAIEKENKKMIAPLGRFKTTQFILVIAIVFAIVLAGISNYSIVNLGYVTLAVIGAAISYLTTKEELGIKDKVTTKVCGAISGDTLGCSNVINSREGKIFGVLSLADSSLLFFISTMLFSVFYGASHTITLVLAWASVPVILFSLYVQAVQLKQFCLLCLLIAAVLVSQLVLLSTTITGWDFSLNEFIGFLFMVSISAFSWQVIKKLWKDSIGFHQTRKEYYRFKRNSNFFLGALLKKDTYPINTIETEHRISFGNSNAAIKIHAVTNPLCGYCQEPFLAYEKLLHTYPNDIQLNLVFNISTDAENKSNRIVTQILEFYQKDKSKAYSALQEWFRDRDMEAWEAKFGSPNSMLLAPQKTIEAHANWCKGVALSHTPETIINGHPFPKKEYEITDLQFFIEPLKSQFEAVEIAF